MTTPREHDASPSIVLLSILGGALGILEGLAALTTSQAVTFGYFVLALAPFVMFLPKWYRWNGWKLVFAALIFAAATTTGVWRVTHQSAAAVPPSNSPSSQPSVTGSPSSPASPSAPAVSITITFPDPGIPNNTSTACLTVQGTSSGVTPDMTIVVTVLKKGDPTNTTSLVGDLGGGRWSASVGLGDPNNPADVNQPFMIGAFVEPRIWIDYVHGQHPDKNWWYASQQPPGALASDSVSTTRVSGGKC